MRGHWRAGPLSRRQNGMDRSGGNRIISGVTIVARNRDPSIIRVPFAKVELVTAFGSNIPSEKGTHLKVLVSMPKKKRH